MSFDLTIFDAALQDKLDTASVSLSAQDYLLLTKAAQAALEISEGVNLLDLKGTPNGVAGLDASGYVPLSQLLSAIPAQGGNSGKYLTTDGASTSWATVDALPSQEGNASKLLSTDGTNPVWSSSASLISLNTSEIFVGNKAYVGNGATLFEQDSELTDALAVFDIQGGEESFAQIAFRNSEPTSSTDIIAYSDNGNDTTGWISLGVTGSEFGDPEFPLTGSNDGYIFYEAAADTTGNGNLIFATGSQGVENKIVFAAGGFDTGNTQMEITPDVNVHIEIPTPSVSATTGALTVVGGVGIQGDMSVQGNVAIEGTITFGGSGTTVETANLSVTDPAVFVGTNNQADIVDLAFIGEYALSVSPITATVSNKELTDNVAKLTTSVEHTFLAGDIVTVADVDSTFNGIYNIIDVPTTTTFTFAKTASNVTSTAVSPTGTATVNARRKFAGIARDASDGVIKVFKDATTKPTSTVNFSEEGLVFAPLKVGAFEASSAVIGNVSNTELQYLDGVTSAIQTQLNDKAPLASPTFTGTVVLPSNTSIGNVTSTELGYLDGATSSIQTQLDAKLAIATAASTYAPLLQTTSTPTFSSNSYSLVSGDANKILLASNGSTAGNITVPSGVFSVGQVITIVQTGTGQLTLQTSGTTINSNGNKYKLNGQYASVQLICTSSNTFLAVGNLVA
jgi:hypothetical protein